MKKPKFEAYTRRNGKNEFLIFYDSLPLKDREKLLATIIKVQDNGLLVSQKLKWIKKLDNNLYELRSKVGSNIQRAIYFHVENQNYLITHGFTKKSQKTPVSEINHGKELRQEYLDDKEK
ncbi:type II toxin-antitoxin system RelE/ParE family toxin [Companilactobacillus muriivasis]|uniref:type II toxin-antitoxin system RelE/ParE family toxin n=1 Tax=Companilactobacillus muriivasis TaxID=3081444 RepID=UPI0030C68AA2